MMAMASMTAWVELGPCFFHHSLNPSVSFATFSKPSGGIRITPVGGGGVVFSATIGPPFLMGIPSPDSSVVGSVVGSVIVLCGKDFTPPLCGEDLRGNKGSKAQSDALVSRPHFPSPCQQRHCQLNDQWDLTGMDGEQLVFVELR